MPDRPDPSELSVPTGTPSFDRPTYVEYEEGEAIPEDQLLVRLVDINLLEVARYYEPTSDLSHTYWHIDPYTGVEPENDTYTLALRVALRTDESVENEPDVDGPTELAMMTTRFIFHIPNISNHIVEDDGEADISLTGPVLAEMLRIAYDGVRGAWCAEMGNTEYGDLLLPVTNVEGLMEDFFEASVSGMKESQAADL